MFGEIYRPVAEVFIQSANGEWYKHYMYIDSGADVSLLPRSVSENLGFTLNKKRIQEVKGIGEMAVPVIVSTVKMRIGSEEFNGRVAFSLIEEIPLILGRTDIFDRFKVTFDQPNKKIIFELRK